MALDRSGLEELIACLVILEDCFVPVDLIQEICPSNRLLTKPKTVLHSCILLIDTKYKDTYNLAV